MTANAGHRLKIAASVLRPDAGPAGEDKQLEKKSFRISGSVDGVLRRVMDKYHHGYAIGHLPCAGSQAQSSVTKLFLYGVSQGEGMMVRMTASGPAIYML
jgi:hypothetical protein